MEIRTSESHRSLRLSPKAIEDFKKIYKEEFYEELSSSEAEDRALNLLRVFQMLLKAIPGEPKDEVTM